jgi:outer membrane cobalamin receptor
MPEHIILGGIKNRNVVKNVGFDVHYRWQNDYEWQNSFAYGTVPSFGSLNASVSYALKRAKTVVKVGGTNLLGEDYRTNIGGPFVGRMVFISLTYDQFGN